MDMNNKSERDRLLDMIDASCDGRIEQSAFDELERELRDDHDARELFVQYRDMHASLRWLSVPEEAAERDHSNIGAAGELVQLNHGRSVIRSIALLSLPVLAASLLLGVLGFWLGTQWQGPKELGVVAATIDSGDSNAKSAAEESDQEESAARITGLVDCQWGQDQRHYGFGDVVSNGESVELTDGLLQLTFNSGAKVIIQGPARFVPQSAMLAKLERGKISALVSESAHGYTVVTPTAEIVDLGTEFAVDVTNDGSTELHVLDGDVLARRRSESEGEGDVIHVRKSDALRFANVGDDVERIAAQPDKFARQITPQLSKAELPPLPVTSDLKFWVAADLLVTRSASGAVSAWQDVCVGDNQVSNDACQFNLEEQPIWLRDAGFGKPAVRFNGTSTRLVTDEFSTGDQVTAFVTCIPSEQGQRKIHHGGHLLNFGGKAPTVEIALHGAKWLYTGLWAANAFGKEFTTGDISTKSVAAGQPVVICYTYDAQEESARQWVNSHLRGEKSAYLHAEVNSQRTIGGHGKMNVLTGYYRGDIYEVLIYDAALKDEEREAVTDYLKSRYQIDG